MSRLRITGLVRLADSVRRELGHGLAPERKAYWQRTVGDALFKVERIFQAHGTTHDGVPPATRRAYLFLKGIDWEAVTPAESGGPANSLLRLSWRGVGPFMEYILDRLAAVPEQAELDGIGQQIELMSRHIEGTITRMKAEPHQITPTGRSQRGWLAFFAEAENRLAYVEAQRLAMPYLESAARALRYPAPIQVQFRPAKNIYRIPRPAGRTMIWLPTPMIAFEADAFRDLAELIRDRTPQAKHRVVEAMESESYQTVHAELESLGGVSEQVRGAHHDLQASFDRVNARYFGGRMPRPHLTWSRVFTGRKMGHYDSIRDTVMISATVDTPKAEPFVLDFLMYHELLHKHLGSRVVNGRSYSHTPEFRALEAKYERHQEAEAALRKLARGG